MLFHCVQSADNKKINLKVKVFFPAENDLVLDLMDLVFNGSQVLSKIHNWHL